MKKLLVSIIIPTYNRVNLISDTLDSIYNQTYTRWECLVIDDRSDDNSAHLIQKYVLRDDRFNYYIRPKSKSKGANSCRNYGFSLCRGEFIIWFDSDDIMHKDLLINQVNSLVQNDKNFNICQALVISESIDNVVGLKSDKIKSNNIFEDYLMKNIEIFLQNTIWKKEFLQELDYLFDEELQAAQEWEFFCRVLNKYSDYSIIEDQLVFIRVHKDNISSPKNYHHKLWNYFLARYKVYSNKDISYTKSISIFLQEFMLFYFKEMIRNNLIKKALFAYFISIIKLNKLTLKSKIFALVCIFSYGIFNRGYFLLKRI